MEIQVRLKKNESNMSNMRKKIEQEHPLAEKINIYIIFKILYFFYAIHLTHLAYTLNSKCKSTEIKPDIVDTLSWTLYISSCLLEVNSTSIS